MNWTISEVKGRAKVSLKMNYWKAVLVSFLLALLFGAKTASSNSVSSAVSGQDVGASALVSTFIDGMSDAQAAAALLFALGLVFTVLAVSIAVSVLWNIFTSPLKICGCRYFIDCHGGYPSIPDSLKACSGYWFHAGVVMVICDVVIGLWSLLFIIPGIYKSYVYRMVPYFLADDPQLSWKEAAERSRELMRGQKFDAFLLDLSFIGWDILSFFTCGLLQLFYVRPYKNMTDAELYRILREREGMPQ